MSVTLYSRQGVAHEVPEGTTEISIRRVCTRCGGGGGAEKWRHTGWTCYRCGGSKFDGVQKVKLYTAEKLAKLNAAQEKRETSRMEAFEASRRAEEASKVARRKAFLVENAADVALLTPLTDSPMFADILSRLTEDLHPLSENQRSAAKREIAKRTEIAASTYLGTVGEKITLVLHCDKIVSFEGFYGTTYLHLCHDKGGNCVTYKGRGNFLGEGDCLPVTAKVAEHSEYNGRKQTRIERPKVAW